MNVMQLSDYSSQKMVGRFIKSTDHKIYNQTLIVTAYLFLKHSQ